MTMDLEIMNKRKKRVVVGWPRIKWGSLTMANALEVGAKLMDTEAWGSNGNANSMWDRTASCIREAAREELESRKVYKCGVKGITSKMHSGRVTGPDEISVEFWQSTGWAGDYWRSIGKKDIHMVFINLEKAYQSPNEGLMEMLEGKVGSLSQSKALDAGPSQQGFGA
ncbi:hypothetical protein H5410_029315 [Solanum commersonii]|uniref:Uncharacterized protein n=1 Tax=Solanum commersonii TaxID=4109 RepID=A0A9J5Z7E0_SOLCO|nr:hypothetical protein H5410_029315 [Solanum commersonii]